MKKILPHIIIILAGMFIVFLAIDTVNSAMAFIDNDITKGLLWVFSILGIVLSCMFISMRGKQK